MYLKGPSFLYDFPSPMVGPEIPPVVPDAPVALAFVEASLGPIETLDDAYSVPVVIPPHDPATHRQLVAIHVVYTPTKYTPADASAEWFMAYTAAPRVSLLPPDPAIGGTVRKKLDTELEGAYLGQIILEFAD